MSGRIGSIGGAAPRVPPHPGGHLGLTWRAPTDDDVAGVVALLVQDARRRRPLRPPSLPELRHTLGTDAGPGRGDALVGVDAAGAVRAAAAVQAVPSVPGAPEDADVYGLGSVDPEWRGRGVGRAVLAWQVARARQLADELAGAAGGAARFVEAVDDQQVGRRRVHAAAGFSPGRSILVLSRGVDPGGPPPDIALPPPPGVEVRAPRAGDAPALGLLQERLRAQRVGEFVPRSDRWEDLVAVAAPPLSAAAFDADGAPVGLLLSTEPTTVPGGAGTCVAALTMGVAPQWRGRGVAHALLGRVHDALAASGVSTHLVEVDVASAVRDPLRGAGYAVVGTRTVYGLDLPASPREDQGRVN